VKKCQYITQSSTSVLSREKEEVYLNDPIEYFKELEDKTTILIKNDLGSMEMSSLPLATKRTLKLIE